MALDQVPHLFHFCDCRNLPLIREHGGLYSLERCDQLGIAIPAPGGDEISRQTDRSKGFHRYVHLSFTAGHPMAHRALESGRIERLAYLQIDRAVLKEEGVIFVPGLANTAGIATYTIEEAQEKGLIDFEILYTRTDWKVPAIQARRQQADKYEILVPNHVPLERILNLPNG